MISYSKPLFHAALFMYFCIFFILIYFPFVNMKCLRRTESIYSNSGNGGLYLFALNTDLFIMLDMLCASIMMLLSFHIDKKSAIFPEFSISEKKCQ